MTICVYYYDRKYGYYQKNSFKISVEKHGEQITIGFGFEDFYPKYGEIIISSDVAKWLSHALLAASEESIKKYPLTVSVEYDQIKK